MKYITFCGCEYVNEAAQLSSYVAKPQSAFHMLSFFANSIPLVQSPCLHNQKSFGFSFNLNCIFSVLKLRKGKTIVLQTML